MLSVAVPLKAEPFLRIVQPFEGATLPAVESSFVFGSVVPATATLTINGIPVEPHTNGGFFTMIPFSEGPFEITAVATTGSSTTTVTRRVVVSESAKPFEADDDTIKPIEPVTRVVLRPSDIILASFQGAPGGRAYFKIGRGRLIPMLEIDRGMPGIYRGSYKIQPDDKFDKDDVLFTLRRKDGKKITRRAGAQIIVQRRTIPRYIATDQDTVLLTGPGGSYGYHLFLEKGVQLEVTGEYGDYLRVALGQNGEGWLRKSHTSALSPGTPPARSVSRNIRIETTETTTVLRIPLRHRHAHRIEQSVNPHRLLLKLYGVRADTDRIGFKSDKSVVREVTWKHDEPDAVTFDIRTNQSQAWGYNVRYEGTTFILEIRHAPQIAQKWGATLKGIRVAVDAGHSPASFGTIGPWGNTEASVNVMTARALKEALERRGAEVVMIQDGTREISLKDRVEEAWERRAHMFISLHCDATGEGNDPRDDHGFSVHYYHPQSRALAEELHGRYKQKSGIPDRGLWRSNLAVCRTTEMPSILFEQAFLILPEFEERLLTPRFQRLIADTIVEAVQAFVDKSK